MWESNLRERTAFYEWTISADDTERRVARALRICVGNEVRKLYGDVPNEPIPSKIADLLHRLETNPQRPFADGVPNESRSQQLSCQGV